MSYEGRSAISWLNETKINAGSTLPDLTKLLVPLNYAESLSGASVNAIDGVPNSNTKYRLW
jgi:hypothetical protein